MSREEFPARVVSGYRITILPVVRKRLGIQIGDDVNVAIEKRKQEAKEDDI